MAPLNGCHTIVVRSERSVRALSTMQALDLRTSTSPMLVAEKGHPWTYPVDRESHCVIELECDVQTPLARGEVIRG